MSDVIRTQERARPADNKDDDDGRTAGRPTMLCWKDAASERALDWHRVTPLYQSASERAGYVRRQCEGPGDAACQRAAATNSTAMNERRPPRSPPPPPPPSANRLVIETTRLSSTDPPLRSTASQLPFRRSPSVLAGDDDDDDDDAPPT